MFYFIFSRQNRTYVAEFGGGLGQDTNLLTSARVSQILMPTLRSFFHYSRASAAHNLFMIISVKLDLSQECLLLLSEFVNRKCS